MSRTSRTGKDTGLGHFPSHDYGLNKAWPDAAMTACILLSWLKLLALDGDLARAEPKTPGYRVLHAAARGGRRRTLKIAATWPWTEAITIAWQRVQAIPHPNLTCLGFPDPRRLPCTPSATTADTA